MKGQMAVFCSLISKSFGECRFVPEIEDRVKEKVLEFYSGTFKKVEGNRFPSWQGFREVAKPHRGKAWRAPALKTSSCPPSGAWKRKCHQIWRDSWERHDAVSVLTFNSHG